MINKYNSYNYINAILPPSTIQTQPSNQLTQQLTHQPQNTIINSGFNLYGTTNTLSAINDQLTNESAFAQQYSTNLPNTNHQQNTLPSQQSLLSNHHFNNQLKIYNSSNQDNYTNGLVSTIVNNYNDNSIKDDKAKFNHYSIYSNNLNSLMNTPNVNNLVNNKTLNNQNLSCLSSSNCSNFSNSSSSNSSLENNNFHSSLQSQHYYYNRQHYQLSSRSFNNNSLTSSKPSFTNCYNKLSQNQPVYTSSYYHQFTQQLSNQQSGSLSESSSLSSSSSIDQSNHSQAAYAAQPENFSDYSSSIAFYKQQILKSEPKNSDLFNQDKNKVNYEAGKV